MAQARRFTLWAHNPEVTGSKRVAGIHSNSPALQKLVVIAQVTLNLSNFKTGMAQRQRAGLITPRTQDRNLLPVSITNRIGASRHWSNTLTSDKEGFGERSSLRSNTSPAWRRHGAVRRFTLWSPNPEVTRSKRVAGILQYIHTCLNILYFCYHYHYHCQCI